LGAKKMCKPLVCRVKSLTPTEVFRATTFKEVVEAVLVVPVGETECPAQGVVLAAGPAARHRCRVEGRLVDPDDEQISG